MYTKGAISAGALVDLSLRGWACNDSKLRFDGSAIAACLGIPKSNRSNQLLKPLKRLGNHRLSLDRVSSAFSACVVVMSRVVDLRFLATGMMNSGDVIFAAAPCVNTRVHRTHLISLESLVRFRDNARCTSTRERANVLVARLRAATFVR